MLHWEQWRHFSQSTGIRHVQRNIDVTATAVSFWTFDLCKIHYFAMVGNLQGPQHRLSAPLIKNDAEINGTANLVVRLDICPIRREIVGEVHGQRCPRFVFSCIYYNCIHSFTWECNWTRELLDAAAAAADDDDNGDETSWWIAHNSVVRSLSLLPATAKQQLQKVNCHNKEQNIEGLRNTEWTHNNPVSR